MNHMIYAGKYQSINSNTELISKNFGILLYCEYGANINVFSFNPPAESDPRSGVHAVLGRFRSHSVGNRGDLQTLEKVDY